MPAPLLLRLASSTFAGARPAVSARACVRLLHTPAAVCAPTSGAPGSQGTPGEGGAGDAASRPSGGVPLGAHTPADAPLHSVSGLYTPAYAEHLRQDDAEDWAFGGGAKSKSGRAAGPLDDFSQVFTVDGTSLWDHVGHVPTRSAQDDVPLSAHTYSGPTGGQTISPFDPTPGVARTTPWGTPAPMESESDILGQRRAEKHKHPRRTNDK